MKKIVLLFLAVAVTLSVVGCAPKAVTPKIGVAIYKFDDTFMSYVRNQIQAAAEGKIELSVQDSQYDQPRQNDQVDQFLAEGCTALAINMVDPSAVSVIIDKCKAKNVPLVLFNREPVAADMAVWDKVYYVAPRPSSPVPTRARLLLSTGSLIRKPISTRMVLCSTSC